MKKLLLPVLSIGIGAYAKTDAGTQTEASFPPKADVRFEVVGTPEACFKLVTKNPALWEEHWDTLQKASAETLLTWAAEYHSMKLSPVLSEEERLQKRTDYDKKAFLLIDCAAGKGYGPALRERAKCYHWGRGVKRDLEIAFLQYQRAYFDHKDGEAANNLGLLFEQERNFIGYFHNANDKYHNDSAALYFARAVFRGYEAAKHNFAFLYDLRKISKEGTKDSDELLARHLKKLQDEEDALLKR